MNGYRQERTSRRLEHAVENIAFRPSLRRRLLERRRAQQLEHLRRADDQRLASRVQDIIVELGLTQTNYSISGGYTLHLPQVVSVMAGPRGGLTSVSFQARHPTSSSHMPRRSRTSSV